MGIIAVPLLPHRRGALFEHVPPTGIGLLIRDGEQQIVALHGRKVLNEKIRAEHAGVEMAAALEEDAVFQLSQESVSFGRRYDAGKEREALVGLFLQDIGLLARIVELAMDEWSDLIEFGLAAASFVLPSDAVADFSSNSQR